MTFLMPRSAATLAIGTEVCHRVKEVRTTSGLLVTMDEVAAFITTIGTLPVGQRPARSILVVADAPVLDRPSTLRILPSGAIEIVYPSLLESQVGISLDGVSFAVDASGFQCTGACLSATPLARNQNSGAFGTTGERWFVVNTTINGWQASEMAGRTIRVNGVLVTPGQMPLPPAVNGSHYFQFSAGSFDWASWSFW